MMMPTRQPPDNSQTSSTPTGFGIPPITGVGRRNRASFCLLTTRLALLLYRTAYLLPRQQTHATPLAKENILSDLITTAHKRVTSFYPDSFTSGTWQARGRGRSSVNGMDKMSSRRRQPGDKVRKHLKGHLAPRDQLPVKPVHT
ncbi:hypothetical protein BaRGS_00015758 [Batillaria attramentaria]|uniref:Uncharacterized protein n=1 Tax=Batillaria attramentaria TaxID=370345 RepID=A0ABD0L0I4_9CAEN